MSRELPMFPLGMVLLPGQVLPLHVFEDRYRRMVVDLLATDGVPEFGVVLIERGHEVGGGEQRSPVGTVARVVHVEALAQGRYALFAVGHRPIEVLRWLEDDPYPRASVRERIDTVEAGLDAALALASTEVRVRAVQRLAAALGEAPAEEELPADPDPVQALYQLVGRVPLGPVDRQRILAAHGFGARLAAFDAALDDLEAVLKFRST